MRRKHRKLKMLFPLNFIERNWLRLGLPFLLSHHLFEASPSSRGSQCHQVDLEWALSPPLTTPVQPLPSSAPRAQALQPRLWHGHATRHAPEGPHEHIVTRTSPQPCVCTLWAYAQSMLKNLKNNMENQQALNVCDISNEATDWVQLVEVENDSFHISGINSRFCSSGNQFLQTILCARSSLWRLVKPFAPNFKNNPFLIIAITERCQGLGVTSSAPHISKTLCSQSCW